jgi:hypothetical protein
MLILCVLCAFFADSAVKKKLRQSKNPFHHGGHNEFNAARISLVGYYDSEYGCAIGKPIIM